MTVFSLLGTHSDLHAGLGADLVELGASGYGMATN